jgi:hypothetical protein
MDLIHTNVELEIGSVVEAVGPPSSNWLCADGQILDQANYPQYVASCQDLHPKSYEGIKYMDERTEVPHACERKGDIIVVVGKGDECLYTIDGGDNWTVNNPFGSSGDFYYGIACDGTTFVTCKYNSNVAYTSTDGINWTSRTMNQSAYWVSVIWTGNYFMALTNSTGSGKIDYSSDGITWYTATPPDTYFRIWYQAWGNNTYLYYSYSDYKWHKTVDGGQNWTESPNTMGWFSPVYMGLTPDIVGFDGTYFVCLTQRISANAFYRSTDGFDWEWIPFTNTRWDYQDFGPACIYYDGGEDVFLLQSYETSYPSWHMAKKGQLENYRKRISQVVYQFASETSAESKQKIAVIPGTGMFFIGWDGVKNREIWADYTRYDSTTKFQLPVLSNGLPGGIKKYIRMS